MRLSSFISFVPISTIIACNGKDPKIEEPVIDKNINLFNTIKIEISDILNNPETRIYLDKKDLDIENQVIKSSLEPIFKEANNDLKKEVFVNNDIISEKIRSIVKELNAKLKEIPTLENNNKIIELNSLQARMNGNDIKTLVDLIEQKQYALSAENSKFRL